MGSSDGNAKEISLGDSFGDVAVKANGVRVEIHTDGSILAYTHGDVNAYTSASVRVHTPANDTAVKPETAPEIGDEMEDGTIYAGISPDTKKPMYATPKDAPGTYTFNKAADYASTVDAHGHHDFHAPSKNELNVLYENRNKGKLKGTFNETGSVFAGWYWSSSQDVNNLAWVQRFSDGLQLIYGKYFEVGVSSLRCVR